MNSLLKQYKNGFAYDDGIRFFGVWIRIRLVELWPVLFELEACFVGLVLMEVLDEAGGKVLGFLIPIFLVSVGVAWVEDVRIDAWESSWNLKVEDWDDLGRGFVDVAIQDRIDDATGILDGDTLASAVPAGVD